MAGLSRARFLPPEPKGFGGFFLPGELGKSP
jgi:hypothetical protein